MSSHEQLDLPAKVLSADEMNQWAETQGYQHVTRGTYTNERTFMYIKSCLQIDAVEDVEPGLALVRHLAEKGILHPATTWGAFEMPGAKGYQLYAVSPAIEAWSVERIGTQDEDRFGHSADPQAEHITEWVRRIEPDYQPGIVPEPGSLRVLLNLTEASNPDNWGWDPQTGINYPVDVEVINLSGHFSEVKLPK